MDKDIKLVALDMDGTVLNNEGVISAENANAIQLAQERGVTVVFSTGRTYMRCIDFAKSLNLSSYLITVNGSEIWDGNGELVERVHMPHESMAWMWNLAKKHQIPFWAVGHDGIWDNKMPEDLTSTEWMKIRFEFAEEELKRSVMEAIHQKGGFEVSNSSPSNLEVNMFGVDKAKAIQKVCGLLDISMDEVMAMGDSLNDLAMIKQAGLGIAMGNAQEAVKEQADWVTAANDQNGVSVALHNWILS
ncbi:Cof-type HAD-IIB family hydrolase [Bacillus sp. 1P06AnD]|uniref:Cof-type HAD-IIB family hydrolase n=1 Tax=Bacillus sp. 1P06AnD TaxID=3132208 RepID=UPI0039A0BD6D